MKTRGTWQSKKNVTSNPNSMEQGSQNGTVDNLELSLGSKPKEHLISMPAQSSSFHSLIKFIHP